MLPTKLLYSTSSLIDQEILNKWWIPIYLTPTLKQQCTQLVFEFYLARKLLKAVKFMIKKDCYCTSVTLPSKACEVCQGLCKLNWMSPSTLRKYLPEALRFIDLKDIQQKVTTEVENHDRELIKSLCTSKPLTREQAINLSDSLMKFFGIIPYDKNDAFRKLVTSIHHVCKKAG